MAIDLNMLKPIAHLARLELNPEEERNLNIDLNNILSMIESIQKVDTDSTQPMAHPFDIYQKLRSDIAEPIENRQALNQLAHQFRDNLYLVPKVID